MRRSSVVCLVLAGMAALLVLTWPGQKHNFPPTHTTAATPRTGTRPAEASVPAVPGAATVTSAPAAPAGSPPATAVPAATLAGASAVRDFLNWSDRYLAATPGERQLLLAEGRTLAAARRPGFQQLIKSDPQLAIELAVPRVVRQELPADILELLEKPISAKGDLRVYMGRPAPGVEVPADALVARYFEADGVTYKAYVYGGLAQVMTRTGIPMRGVAIDNDLALAENAVRPLELGERIAPGTIVEESCPVSGKTTSAPSTGSVVTEATPVVEVAGRTIALCQGEHVAQLEQEFSTFLQASGPGSAGFFYDNFPGTSSRAIGNLRCLYIRATYPEQLTPPNTEEQAYADMRDNARFFLESSFGKLTQTATVTSVVTLPHTMAWYKDKDRAAVGSIDGLYQVHVDAVEAARKLGYDSSGYDCIILRVNGGPRLEGISWGGGERVWLSWDGMDVINHEVGHSLGRNHANFWESLDGTPYGHGQNAEYGNPFDTMGGGGGFSAHYNSISKRALGWLPDAFVHQVKTNGVYRIYAYDQPTLQEGKRYALTVPKDNVRQYNLEYHPARGGLLAESALVIYTGTGSNAGHLLDTTQGSPGGKNDGGIAIGRTHSDYEADMHFTVLGKNPTTPPSLDIAFQRGPFPGNRPPVVALNASATTLAAGGSVTFTATASDPDGDALAYYWEFDDGQTGTNSPSFTRTFNSVAQVTAMLSVSDMKGGLTRRSVVINVGAHGRQTVTGVVTADGIPLQGVTISGGGKRCISDADGSYSLSGLTTGSKTLTCTLNGYTFTPQFSNPINVVAGTNTANWTATSPTFVTLTKVADPTEGGAPGRFRLTRNGPTTEALSVSVSRVGGTATKGTDYTFAPDYAALGSFYTFTIPAGAASLDIVVNAASTSGIEDALAEGPETITLQLTSAPGYLSNSGNAALMVIHDNDSILPQVSVAATGPYASEGAGGEAGTITIKRTGATSAALSVAINWSGSATNGADCASLPASVMIPAGDDSVDITVQPLNDSLIETPETVVATLSSSPAYLLEPGGASATVTLSDDDTPVVNVSVPDANASELGCESGVVMFTRTGSLAAPLKVYYGVSGSAQHGTDYAALTGEVVIAAGSASAVVVITPMDDDIAEPTETVTVALANFNNTYSIGHAFQGTVNLTDNSDLPVVSVRPGSVGVEGGANPTVIFQASTSQTNPLTISYAVAGTADSGSDFSALTGTIVIPAGSKQATLTIPAINDTLAEPTETVVITIATTTSYLVYNEARAEAIIRDNDSGERVMVSTYHQSPTELGTTATYYLSRTGTSGDLTVNYAMSGTASNGQDYRTLPGSVVIPNGQPGVNLVLTPIDDTLAEGTETATLTILPGSGYGPDRPNAATFEIADNDAPTLSVGFQMTSMITSELPTSSGDLRDIPVVLSAPAASTVSVTFTSAGGSAVGDDVDWCFVDPADNNKVIPAGTLTFLPGVTSQNLRIRIKNDGVPEGSETIVLALAGARNASITSGRSQLNVTVFDDELPVYVTEERWNSAAVYTNNSWGASPPSYSGLLGSFTPAFSVGDQYSRRLVGQVVAPATGAYTFWLAGDNVARLFLGTSAAGSSKVKIAEITAATGFQQWDNNPAQKSATINLTAGEAYYMEVQQQETTGSDHVSVAWQGPGFARTPVSVPVPDNARRTVRFLAAATTRAESDGNEPLLQVLLDRPAGTTPISVDVSASGSATLGSDFTFAATTVTFNPGEQLKQLPLSILTDNLVEGPEQIIITLGNPKGVNIASPAAHTITLLDSNSAPVRVASQFLSASSTMPAGSVLGTASATAAPGRTIASWTIVSGNTNNAFSISNGGQLTLTTPAALPNPGGVQLIVRATDNTGASGEGAMNIICNAGSKPVVEQRWSGTTAFASESWSATPSFTGTLSTPVAAQNVGDSYSRRLTTFLKPAVSGTYTFWIAGDDDCRLYLGSDGYQANKELVAWVDGWTDYQAWDANPSQKSVGIQLEAGKVYWLEAQQQENYGGDHLSVAWSGPGIARTVIPTTVLMATAPGIDFPLPGSAAGGNSAPTISTLSNRSISEDSSTGIINVTVGDAESGPGAVVLTASSSNQRLVPNSRITLGGSGASRTVSIAPALNQNGTSVISLTASDGLATTTSSYVLTVSANNDAPKISPIAGQSIPINSSTGQIPFTISDVETPAGSLTVTVSSSNTLLVPTNRVAFTGTGNVRTLRVTPAADQVGTATLTVRVSDGGRSASAAFTLTVTGTAIQEWRQASFGTAAASGNYSDDADPDDDGIVNLAEYALGLDPLAANPPSANVRRVERVVGASRYLGLSIQRNPEASGLSFVVEASNNASDPASWSTAGTVVETNTSSTLIVRDSTPLGSQPKRYLRLRISAP